MSETATTSASKTKTGTFSEGPSDYGTEDFDTDRWSNHITYHQLVVSTCISITQLWWHPYLDDLSRHVPFLVLYLVFSVLVAFPLFYLELAVGAVTRKNLVQCWDISPLARGTSITSLCICLLTAMPLSLVAAYSLHYLVHSCHHFLPWLHCTGLILAPSRISIGTSFTSLCICLLTAMPLSLVAAYSLHYLVHSCHHFLPWLHCAAAARPPCSGRHRAAAPGADTPAASFFFNFVLNLHRTTPDRSGLSGGGGGLGNIVWELAVYYTICWVLIYFIAFKKIYSYSKLVLFKDTLAYLTLVCCSVGVMSLQGAGRMMQECNWSELLDVELWREAAEYSLLQMSVGQGTLIMLGGYCPGQRQQLHLTSVLGLVASTSSTILAAVVLGAVHGALKTDYDDKVNLDSGASAALILWSDLAARAPGSQFWAALIFFTLFVLALTATALLVQTMMSSLSAACMRNNSWAALLLACTLHCLVGYLLLCTEMGINILNFLIRWPASRLRPAAAAVAALAVTYFYGQKLFCEGIYEAVGEYPPAFFRVSWAVSPWVMLIMFMADMDLSASTWERRAGWLLVSLCSLPIFACSILYVLFKCRIRNMVTEK